MSGHIGHNIPVTLAVLARWIVHNRDNPALDDPTSAGTGSDVTQDVFSSGLLLAAGMVTTVRVEVEIFFRGSVLDGQGMRSVIS